MSIFIYILVLTLCLGNKVSGDVNTSKNPHSMITEAGFECENHTVTTNDGYELNLVRIINPLVAPGVRLKRPILFNHGLFESSTIWLFNSAGTNIARHYPPTPSGNLVRLVNGLRFNHTIMRPENFGDRSVAPFMLANAGYDVFLLSMRGTEYSLGHTNMTSKDSKYWDYSWDDFALSDVPDTLKYIQELTQAKKIGYAGHSQATFAMMALLTERPKYAHLVEPIIFLCPVSFLSHMTSIGRPLFVDFAKKSEKGADHGPFPPFATKLRNGFGFACNLFPELDKVLCNTIYALIGGTDSGKENPLLVAQLPYLASTKVLSHMGQLIMNGRFCKYDYVKLNKQKYGIDHNPDYNIAKIRSKSMVFMWTRSDSITVPRDVKKFISKMKVKPYRSIYIDADFNHFDVLGSPGADRMIMEPMVEIFEEFESRQRSVTNEKRQIPATNDDVERESPLVQGIIESLRES